MEAQPPPVPSSTRRLFVSYAREDRDPVDRLRVGLQRLRHEVWLDDRLSVGEAWWASILEQIRQCDAMVVAVSPALLESEACTVEREYARMLGKVLLPVSVRAVRTELLPPDLAPVQMVDFATPTSEGAFDLSYALALLPASPPLPEPLPEPPPIPVSYLSDLNVRVHARTLSLDEQLALVSRLKGALARAQERDAALELLRALQQREDLYHASAQELEAVIRAAEGPARPPAPPATSPTPSSAGTASATGATAGAQADRPPPPPPGWTGARAAPASHRPPPPQRTTAPAAGARPATWAGPAPVFPVAHAPSRGSPPVAPRDAPPPRWTLAWSSFALSLVLLVLSYGWLFPLLIGVSAPLFSRRVASRLRLGDLRGAVRASAWAQRTGIFGVVVSATLGALLLVALMLDPGMYQPP